MMENLILQAQGPRPREVHLVVIILFLPVRVRQLPIFSRDGKDQVEYGEPFVSWLERWLTEKNLELGDKG